MAKPHKAPGAESARASLQGSQAATCTLQRFPAALQTAARARKPPMGTPPAGNGHRRHGWHCWHGHRWHRRKWRKWRKWRKTGEGRSGVWKSKMMLWPTPSPAQICRPRQLPQLPCCVAQWQGVNSTGDAHACFRACPWLSQAPQLRRFGLSFMLKETPSGARLCQPHVGKELHRRCQDCKGQIESPMAKDKNASRSLAERAAQAFYSLRPGQQRRSKDERPADASCK